MKRIIVIITILVTGIGMLSYPFVSNYLNQINGTKAIQEYSEEVKNIDSANLKKEQQLAEEYNLSLTGQGIKDPFVPDSGMVRQNNYDEIMDFANHIMGYIEIPNIDVYLPIYHGVTDDVLVKGAGHMSETAFPIGGKGNHSVITGHTGLSSAKLFTDLAEIKEKNVFYIHVFNEILAYQVDQIKIVDPQNTEDLLPVQEKDYVTLITCTPYAVNSHRLLVRGTRIEYSKEQYEEIISVCNTSEVSKVDIKIMIYGIVTTSLMIAIIVTIVIGKKRRANKSENK